jgi:hypothetical protein
VSPPGLSLAMVLLIVMCGCTHHPRGTYALATTEAVPRGHVTELGQQVEGEYCARLPQFLDRDGNINKYRKAALDALGKAPGANALVDVKISITSGNCARVEGKPVKLH